LNVLLVFVIITLTFK